MTSSNNNIIIHKFLLIGIYLSFSLVCFSQTKPGNEQIDPKLFLNPPLEYKSVPFYSLNDSLDAQELDRQLKGFKEAGFGGTFLHSRIGLLTDFLSKEWFAAMDAGVRTSQNIGIDAWFYDEDKWPSGFAGGKIPKANQDFLARCIVRLTKDAQIRPGDTLLWEDNSYKYVCHRFPMGSSWYGGGGWVDLLNPEMVRAFIDTAYTPYVKRYGGQPHVLGMFTDEPQISAKPRVPNKGAISFSPAIVDTFKKMHGYNPIPKLPLLFDSTGDYRKFRLDYYRTLGHCFEHSFSKQIGDYCKENGLIFTGHLNGEESPVSNMVNSGNAMIQYRHFQMPGIDALGLNYNTLHNVKAMSGVANQYNIERRIVEAFGVSGQNMSFEDRKWILDWLTILGVNFICPHLSLYSMKGERKRDYPPTFSAQQPYWRYNKLYEDYSARMCYINTLGRYTADVLVLHPIESFYIDPADPKQLNEKLPRNVEFEQVLQVLQDNHRNWDLGDEQIISDIAKVEGNRLVLGSMAYITIILPGMLTIRQSTLDLLKKFHANGGKIYVTGEYPKYVDGVENSLELNILKSIAPLKSKAELVPAINSTSKPPFTVEGADNQKIWTSQRSVTNGNIIQLTNTSRLQSYVCDIGFTEQPRHVLLWNPVNGEYMDIKRDKNGKYRLKFNPTQTWILATGLSSTNVKPDKVYQIEQASKDILVIDKEWKGKRVDPNAITLDFAAYSTNDGETYSNPEPVLGIHQRFTDHPYNGELRLKYAVDVKEIPANCSLVVEQPHMCTSITVNGAVVKFTGKDFYRDHTFRSQNISGKLKEGKNEIILTLNYKTPVPLSLLPYERYGTEIESIYLTGDFAVDVVKSEKSLITTERNETKRLQPKPIHSISSFILVKEKQIFKGDLAVQGYPFYAGEFLLTGSFEMPAMKKGKRYVIHFPLSEAIVINVEINGQKCAPIFFSPWETDITSFLKEGHNEIRISLTNSLRNLLGPHHHKSGELINVSPDSFNGRSTWTSHEKGEKDWYDQRLTGKTGIWRDDYYIIPFGLLEAPVIREVFF